METNMHGSYKSLVHHNPACRRKSIQRKIRGAAPWASFAHWPGVVRLLFVLLLRLLFNPDEIVVLRRGVAHVLDGNAALGQGLDAAGDQAAHQLGECRFLI